MLRLCELIDSWACCSALGCFIALGMLTSLILCEMVTFLASFFHPWLGHFWILLIFGSDPADGRQRHGMGIRTRARRRNDLATSWISQCYLKVLSR